MQVEQTNPKTTRTPPASPLKRASKRLHLDGSVFVIVTFKDKKGDKYSWSLPLDSLTLYDENLLLGTNSTIVLNCQIYITLYQVSEKNHRQTSSWFVPIMISREKNWTCFLIQSRTKNKTSKNSRNHTPQRLYLDVMLQERRLEQNWRSLGWKEWWLCSNSS